MDYPNQVQNILLLFTVIKICQPRYAEVINKQWICRECCLIDTHLGFKGQQTHIMADIYKPSPAFAQTLAPAVNEINFVPIRFQKMLIIALVCKCN